MYYVRVGNQCTIRELKVLSLLYKLFCIIVLLIIINTRTFTLFSEDKYFFISINGCKKGLYIYATIP